MSARRVDAGDLGLDAPAAVATRVATGDDLPGAEGAGAFGVEEHEAPPCAPPRALARDLLGAVGVSVDNGEAVVLQAVAALELSGTPPTTAPTAGEDVTTDVPAARAAAPLPVLATAAVAAARSGRSGGTWSGPGPHAIEVVGSRVCTPTVRGGRSLSSGRLRGSTGSVPTVLRRGGGGGGGVCTYA